MSQQPQQRVCVKWIANQQQKTRRHYIPINRELARLEKNARVY